MSKKYYVRVPHGESGDYSYVEVDPTTLDISILTQLWIRERSSDNRFRPAFGVESLIKTGLDLSTIVQTYQDLLEQIQVSLSETDNEGWISEHVVAPLTNLAGIFEQIEKGQVGAAKDTMTDMLYTLMSELSVLADKIDASQNLASGMAVYGEAAEKHASQTEQQAAVRVRKAEEALEDIYLSWIDSAEGLIKTIEKLAKHKEFIEAAVDQIKHETAEWTKHISPHHPRMDEALNFFEEFSGLAVPFLMSGTEADVEKITALCDQAREHLDYCHTQVAEAENNRQRFIAVVRDSLETRRSEIEDLCQDLKKYRKKLKEAIQQNANQTPPYEVFDGELISQERYQKALDYLGQGWTFYSTKQYFIARLDTAHVLVRDPIELPPDTLAIQVDAVESYLERIQETITGLTGVSPAPPPAPPPSSPPPSPTSHVGTPKAPTAVSIDPDRAQHLYELVICIGYEITKNPNHQAASTIKAMLDVIPFMNIGISAAEVEMYRQEVLEISHHNGQRETVRVGKKVRQRVKESKACWISYSPRKGQWGLKLTQHSNPKALELLTKHALTPEEIRAAYDKKKESQKERYRNRSNGSDSDPDTG